ncbi:hypothetical protein M404DRAFT_718075 [Pisolithus tinctorius Marx 270]|uniref:Uncharacterized protein n=1 Tax=Pisolithus tinctorius Marx 270 TaxID=870435 RepID=A0A0C3IYR3_PISTI|nr:hypothetical protein M404DRAFT_718075 [Pisolithus tinctorius Marx 270]
MEEIEYDTTDSLIVIGEHPIHLHAHQFECFDASQFDVSRSREVTFLFVTCESWLFRLSNPDPGCMPIPSRLNTLHKSRTPRSFTRKGTHHTFTTSWCMLFSFSREITGR